MKKEKEVDGGGRFCSELPHYLSLFSTNSVVENVLYK